MKTIIKKYITGSTKLSTSMIAFFFKNEDKNYDIKELSKIFKKDRTTIQKTIQYLVKYSIIKKYQINLKRGFKYVYTLENKKELYLFLEKKIQSEYDREMKLLIRYVPKEIIQVPEDSFKKL
jgi:predicted transcriptional regulator